MDHARRLGGLAADGDGPGTDFLLAGGVVGLVAQQAIGRPGQRCQGGLFHAHIGEHLGFVLVVQLRELALDAGADGDHLRPDRFGMGLDALGQLALAVGIVVADIGDVEDGLGGDQTEHPHGPGQLGVGELDRAGGLALFEHGDDLLEHLHACDGVAVARTGVALGLGQGVLAGLEVGEDQLQLDGFNVTHGIDRAVDMGDVLTPGCLLEATDNLNDGVDILDVAQEGVALALTLGRPADEPGDIDQFQRSGDDLLGLDIGLDDLQARIGDRDDTDVGVDRREGVVGGQRASVGQRVKEG